MTPRLAAGAAALVVGAGLAVAAVPASAAPAAAPSHTVTYSPGAVPVLGLGGIVVVPGVTPSISSPDGGAVHAGDTIVFKTTGPGATVQSTTSNWSFKLPVTSAQPASVTVPGAGTFGYGVRATTKTFQATAPGSSGSTQPSGGGVLPGAPNPAPVAQPPAAGTGGGGAPANGSGAAGSGAAGSGAAGATGSGGSSGDFNKAQFGNGSGDFPNLPGGVLAPVAPQAGSTDGGPPPEIAGLPATGGQNVVPPLPTAKRSGDTLTNASQVTDPGSGSSVIGPATVAAALLALVIIGLARAWATDHSLRRH